MPSVCTLRPPCGVDWLCRCLEVSLSQKGTHPRVPEGNCPSAASLLPHRGRHESSLSARHGDASILPRSRFPVHPYTHHHGLRLRRSGRDVPSHYLAASSSSSAACSFFFEIHPSREARRYSRLDNCPDEWRRRGGGQERPRSSVLSSPLDEG